MLYLYIYTLQPPSCNVISGPGGIPGGIHEHLRKQDKWQLDLSKTSQNGEL